MGEALRNETQILLQARAGSKEAFEQLVLHYRPQAVRFAQSLIHDSFYAEDIAQEAFAKAWLRLDSFRIGASFKSWLFTIIRNRCIDHLRGAKPASPLPEEFDLPGGDEPQALLDSHESWEEFLTMYKTLPGDAQTALYLFAAEKMPYQEIARVLGKNTAQIKMLLYRARKKLKQMEAAR